MPKRAAAHPGKKPLITAAEHSDGEIPFALPKVKPAEKRRAEALLAALTAEYPTAHCELNYTSPHELLVATILSAQTTDVGVNKATPALFARFRRSRSAASPA